MRLLDFRLTGFAQHHDTRLTFATDSPSLIIGPNESGKSHLLSALIGVLFGMPDWKRNVPWEGDGLMCGELRFEADEGTITLVRHFSENQVVVSVDGHTIYRGRGLPGRKTPEDEKYQAMLARW
ncbi:MAG TPA: AAA family ATPase, partial [Nitrolancea sp.]|nr:AAA family ATPase [Nitrolancea sp.]